MFDSWCPVGDSVMLTKEAFLLHYRALQDYANFRNGNWHYHGGEGVFTLPPLTQREADYIWHFLRPYVCVIHESTGRGYYLNRNYEYIISVEDILRPGVQDNSVPTLLTRVVEHETELQHQATSFTTPEWAILPSSEFTSYWLY